jgi:hypothetical protein
MATQYVVKQKIIQHLEEHSNQAISDKEASSLRLMEALTQAQEFDNAYTRQNGPGQLTIVPHNLSSF